LKKNAYGTYAIAKIFQVAPITVGRWIKEGKLPFFTTGGGHRRVWVDDLINFLKAHKYPVPKILRAVLEKIILVVENDPGVLKAIHQSLKMSFPKAEINVALSGYEAGAQMAILVPDAVLLSLSILGSDPLRICQGIRKNNAYRDVKIIAIDGNGPGEMEKSYLKAGADAFLKRPFKTELLQKILSKLFSR